MSIRWYNIQCFSIMIKIRGVRVKQVRIKRLTTEKFYSHEIPFRRNILSRMQKTEKKCSSEISISCKYESRVFIFMKISKHARWETNGYTSNARRYTFSFLLSLYEWKIFAYIFEHDYVFFRRIFSRKFFAIFKFYIHISVVKKNNKIKFKKYVCI